jgi:hypothetical protein
VGKYGGINWWSQKTGLLRTKILKRLNWRLAMLCPYCKKEFSVKEAKIRSLQENSYYWGVCLKILSEDTGYTPNEMHEVCRSMFLNEKVMLKINGKMQEKTIPISTTGLTTIEFEEYLSKIRQWASIELSCYLPLPNELEVQ